MGHEDFPADGRLPGRTYRILFRKYHMFLFPSMLSIMALTVNEFVDGMIVANLMGSRAMTAVSLGYPVLFLIATVYMLIGTGGGTLYAILLGEHKGDDAAKVCCLSLAATFLAGFLMMATGLLLEDELMPLLCPDEELMAAGFPSYYRALLISAPVMATVLTLFGFLATSGAPMLSTGIHIASNAVNLLMDYVYIAHFGLGVAGAAWATVTGYLAGFAILLVPLCTGRTPIRVRRAGTSDLPLLREALGRGGAAAASQFGMALKFAACNVLAVMYGGAGGAVAFSVCVQAISFGSVFYAGAMGAANPLLSMLQGQRDLSGKHRLLRRSLLYGLALATPFALWAIARPEDVAAIYKVTEPMELSLALAALPVVALSFWPRAFCVIFMYYLQILGRNRYAMFVSLFDGVLGTVPLALLCCHLAGMNGLWWTFPIDSFLHLFIILGKNRLTALSSKGRYHGFLLRESDDAAETLDFTMTGEPEMISRVSRQIASRLAEAGLPEGQANRVGLAVEEMAVYNGIHQKSSTPLDVLLRLYPDRAEIDCRSAGEPCDPTEDGEADDLINLRLLRELASVMAYDYVLGLNSTHIVLRLKNENRY